MKRRLTIALAVAVTLGLVAKFVVSPYLVVWLAPLLGAPVLAWTIAVVVFNILVSLSRPAGFTLHVLINQTVVLATFLVIPLRYSHRLLCGLGGAAAYLGAMVAWRRLPVTQVLPLAVAVAIAAAIGGIAAFRIERLRRLEFANLTEARRINRELAANFCLPQFAHRAFYNAEHGRIEMHLVSRREQRVRVGGARFSFAAGESNARVFPKLTPSAPRPASPIVRTEKSA